jgi:RimJ/RimL family protein N-acetyltransferase
MASEIVLRDVIPDDLTVFFEHQLDPAANRMAAFTANDPSDRDAFDAKWMKILEDDSITKKTILFNGQVAGSLLTFLSPWSGKLEVAYWLGREFWGQGICTRALSTFLRLFPTRPLYAGAARDNLASIRVLQKCGFTLYSSGRGFSHARGEEIDEVLMVLKAAAVPEEGN